MQGGAGPEQEEEFMGNQKSCSEKYMHNNGKMNNYPCLHQAQKQKKTLFSFYGQH